MATLGMSPQEKEAVETFRRDVVEPSMTKLVIIDFWAEWCGPCKALAPILEKVAAAYADQGVVLAKIDTDRTSSSRRNSRCGRSPPSMRCSRASWSPI